jgi:Flp pilus assembly protein TadG
MYSRIKTRSTSSSTPITNRLHRLAREEDGAAYTLSYVMVIPLYALLLCLIVETVFMLTAKLGTVYAAYAAARTASVWSSHTTWDKAMAKAEKAAFKTMTPFASGLQPLTSSVPTPDAAVDSALYLAAYNAFAEDPVAAKYLLAKYGYASRHTEVSIEGPPATWDADITAKVTYDFPFNVPGIGRLLGRRGFDGRYYYSLTSQATIPNEGPQNNRNTIGIGYGTLE